MDQKPSGIKQYYLIIAAILIAILVFIGLVGKQSLPENAKPPFR